MRKLVGLLLIVFALAALAAPAAAVPVADLTALARYFNAETVFFGSIRTDDGYIETLDTLIDRVTMLLPEDQRSPVSLREALDGLFTNFPPGANTVEAAVRPWLGDTAALGVKNFDVLFDDSIRNDNDIPFMVALANRDRAAALEFFRTALVIGEQRNPLEYTVTETAAYTLLTPGLRAGAPPFVYIDDQVVLLARGAEQFPTGGLLSQSLATSADFTAAFAALPAGDYNIGLYLNIPALLDTIIALSNTLSRMGSSDAAALQSLIEPMQASLRSIGGQAWGFTILDGRSLTIDIAQSGDIAGILAAMPAGSPAIDQPVDQAFLGRIPAGAPAVILASQLGFSVQSALDNLVAQAQAMSEMDVDADEVTQALAQLEFLVQGLTGLDLREEILPWMNGEYALYFSLNPALNDIRSLDDSARLTRLPAEAALIMETSNPELSAQLVAGLGRALTSFGGDNISVTTEQLGRGRATVVTIPTPGVSYPVELLIASDDNVFVIGTRGAVIYALSPDGPSLLDDPLYQEALTYALPNSISFLYLAGAGLEPLVRIVDVSSPSWSRDAEGVAFLLDLFHSSSITTQVTETAQIVRLVMTLPE
ncbi:MAG: DUF3352 domain-containing protein [Candidatus Flexifilum sp.]